METFRGKIENTRDALIIFEACRLGILQRITRRCLEEEKKEFVPGSVFVYDEDESGIKRWTDGIKWSPSRIYGDFLLYQELEYRLHSVKSFEEIDETIKKRIENENLKYHVCNKGTFVYSKEGFNKKTISVTVDGSLQHMIIYEDKKGSHDNLHPPWAYVELSNIEPSKAIIKQLGLRKKQQCSKDIKENSEIQNVKSEDRNHVDISKTELKYHCQSLNLSAPRHPIQTLPSIVDPFSPVHTPEKTPETEITDPMKITSVINWLGDAHEKSDKSMVKGNVTIPLSPRISSSDIVASTSSDNHYGIMDGFSHNPWHNSFSNSLRSRVTSFYPSMVIREPLLPYNVPHNHVEPRHDPISHDYYGFMDYSRF
ncbi:6988_t:CDS:2 [Acaulospora morrowiae]|uniref:6987_t:CDS:1 n=1 Tax=Acaulospora morrowiae TaxID=94023 RepID=A0A9N8YTC3_9GLOM|nr:6987_t:CDS:2 [Acaulospora morrowiae]CAG8447714.1 6988_t:CDS:2 [Acaulospora morrowiae]